MHVHTAACLGVWGTVMSMGLAQLQNPFVPTTVIIPDTSTEARTSLLKDASPLSPRAQ